MSIDRKPTLALIAGCLALTGVMASSVGAQSTGDAAAAGANFTGPSGEDTFKHVCAACHMPDAKGAQGAGYYPALAGNPKLSSGAYPVYVVMNGLNGMPPLGEMMTDQQVADVVNYVRTHFGNDYRDAVKPADVSALR